jgi:hypothetical protein
MKKITLLLIAIVLCNAAIAQWSFLSGLNISISDSRKEYLNVITSPTKSGIYSYRTTAIGYNGIVIPRYHLSSTSSRSNSRSRNSRGGGSRSRSSRASQSTNSLFDYSINLPISLGINGFGGQQGILFFYGLGSVAAINFGNFKVNDESGFGAFAGLGIGAINTNGITILGNNLEPEPTVSPKSWYKDINANDLGNYTPRALSVGPLVQVGLKLGKRNGFGIIGGYQVGVNRYGKNYYSITVLYSGLSFGNSNWW